MQNGTEIVTVMPLEIAKLKETERDSKIWTASPRPSKKAAHFLQAQILEKSPDHQLTSSIAMSVSFVRDLNKRVLKLEYLDSKFKDKWVVCPGAFHISLCPLRSALFWQKGVTVKIMFRDKRH